MEEQKKGSCNRTPFASDDRCDRGDVDIHQFDDFPMCDLINPSLPGIPPEVVDTPISLPAPPTCSCININYKFKFDYNKSGKSFDAGASFRVEDSGDCCEGKYETRFNMLIPCPIIKKDKDAGKIKVSIKYGDSGSSAEEPFMNADSSSCTIEPLHPILNLNIPCPARTTGKKKIKVGIDWGDGDKEQSRVYVSEDKEKCEIEFGDSKGDSPSINLNLPCPVKTNGKKTIIAEAKWHANGDKDAESQSFIETSSAGCSITPKDVVLPVDIPWIFGDGNKTISAKGRWGLGFNTHTEVYADIKQAQKQIEFKTPVPLVLNVPCPISKQHLIIEQPDYSLSTDSPGFFLIKDSSFVSEGSSSSYVGECKRYIKFKVKFPKGGTGMGGYRQPFEFEDCCCVGDDFYFDGTLQHADWANGAGCPDAGSAFSIYLICKGTRDDGSSSSESYTWEFYLSTSPEQPGHDEKILNVKLYDISDECKVLKDYRGVNLPVMSGAEIRSTFDDYGPFAPVYYNGSLFGVGEGFIQVGGYTIHIYGTEFGSEILSSEFICIRVMSADSGGSGAYIASEILLVSDLQQLNGLQSNLDYLYIPIYRLVNTGGKTTISMDLRRMPTTGMLEAFLGDENEDEETSS